MKVLKDNYSKAYINERLEITKPYPRKHICDSCGSELEYEENDLYMGAYGCMHLDCPLCGEDNMLDTHEKNIILTNDNIEFPTHFHHVCVENGAVDRSNTNEVRSEINRGIKFLREHRDEYHWETWCGSLYVSVNKWSDDEMYDVTVADNFYNMDIQFEAEDY